MGYRVSESSIHSSENQLLALQHYVGRLGSGLAANDEIANLCYGTACSSMYLFAARSFADLTFNGEFVMTRFGPNFATPQPMVPLSHTKSDLLVNPAMQNPTIA